MSDHIDHAAEALRVIMELPSGDTLDQAYAYAQVHATLAMVEQLRIGNLVALAGVDASRLGLGGVAHDRLSNARNTPFGEVVGLAPDIAATLGIGGDPHQHDPTCSKHGDTWPCITPQASCVAECAECSETLDAGGESQ